MVRMIGSCEDCPSSSITLKQGVERMIMHYIPEVKRVLNKGDEELPLEERERKSQEEREDMNYIENFNKELDKLIAEEKERMKSEAKKKSLFVLVLGVHVIMIFVCCRIFYSELGYVGILILSYYSDR